MLIGVCYKTIIHYKVVRRGIMKRFLTALFSVLLVFFLGGCAEKQEAESTEQTKRLLLGFAQIGSESSWRIGNTESVIAAAKKYDIDLMSSDANQQQANEITAMRTFIAYRVDVLAFVPIVEDGWENVLQEARDAGIKVICSDRQISSEIDDSLYDCYIGADFLEEGRNAGKYLLRRADDLGREKLNIVEISGTVNSTPALERSEGFHEIVDRDGRFSTLETISGDFLRSKGKECMEYLLQEYGSRIDVLFSHNDGMTLGAIEAIEAAGMRPGEDIIIISVDGEQDAIDLLKAGKINCVVECTPMLGDLVMETALKLAAGESVPKVTHPEEAVFSDYDDLSDLPPRGY